MIVPAFRAQRRIQALMRLGWTAQDIAIEAGFKHRNGVHRILAGQKGKPCRYVLLDTHRVICDTYDRMSMRLPEPSGYRTRARRMAERNSWPPPLAWDDIDNADEIPSLGATKPRVLDETKAAHIENFDWLVSQGESPELAAQQVGIQVATIANYRGSVERVAS